MERPEGLRAAQGALFTEYPEPLTDTKLAEEFAIPPWAFFDTRQGYWQEQKRAWKELGIQSELGRDKNLLGYGPKAMIGVGGTSIFDPVLCQFLVYYFSPTGGWVLDPFAGGSVRGIVSGVLGRHYVGVDLSRDQIDENNRQAQAIEEREQRGEPKVPMQSPFWIVGDSRDLADLVSPFQTEYDFVLSCPPFGNLEQYSDDPRDLSTLEYAAFLESYAWILHTAFDMLKPDRFAALVVRNFRGPDKCYNLLVPDTITCAEASGLRLYNDCILATTIGTLPIRAPWMFSCTRKILPAFQNVLVFVKGSVDRALEALGVTQMSASDWGELTRAAHPGMEELPAYINDPRPPWACQGPYAPPRGNGHE